MIRILNSFAGSGTGKFSVSDLGDENLDPRVVAPRRAPLTELSQRQHQSQSQPPESTGDGFGQGIDFAFAEFAEYHDPSIPRWISSDPYIVENTFSPTLNTLCWRFIGDPKPVLPRTYEELERRHFQLCSFAALWVEKFFTPELHAPKMTSAEAKKLGEENPLLVRWIDSVASAFGFCWLNVLHEKRYMIAMGVLGKVLEDRVFKDEYFGAPDEDKKLLRAIDRELEMREVYEIGKSRAEYLSDAFGRQKPRATYINESLSSCRKLPKHFATDVNHLFHQLVALLRPLLPTNEKQFPMEEYYETLNWIIALAGKLSLDMRREPDTVYYVAMTPPRHKGLDAERMSPVVFCAEEEDNINEFRENYTNVISVWPGVFAYRRLSHSKVSFRTIRRALVYSSNIEEKYYPRRTERNPDRISYLAQFWQYLRFLGVPINAGRNWYQ